MVKYGKIKRSRKYKAKSWKKAKAVTRKIVRRAAPIPKSLPVGFPAKYVCKHTYSEVLTLDPDVITYFDYGEYRCNGMYDPSVKYAGHQPKMYDQLSALFNHYTVIGAKITVTPIPLNSSVAAVPHAWGLVKQNDLNETLNRYTSGGIEDLLETNMPGARGRMKHGGYGFYNANSKANQLTLKWSAKKDFKVKSLVGNNAYAGTDSSNPTEQSFFCVWAAPLDASSNATSLRYRVYIEYIAVWWEPKQVGLS